MSGGTGPNDPRTLPQFVVDSDLSDLSITEGLMDSPRMGTNGALWVTIAGGPFQAGASVIGNYAEDGGEQLNALVSAAIVSGLDGGTPTTQQITPAHVFRLGHSVAPGDVVNGLASASALYAQDQQGGVDDGSFQPCGVLYGDDGVLANNMLMTGAFLYADNGLGTFDIVCTGTGTNLALFDPALAVMAAAPGEWSVTHTPAVNTVATITRAAGGAGIRHVLRSFTATVIGLAAAAEAVLTVNIRDGASGAGTILKSFPLYAPPGGQNGLAMSDLNIVGSENTAMTIEFTAAGGANTYESVSMSGNSAA